MFELGGIRHWRDPARAARIAAALADRIGANSFRALASAMGRMLRVNPDPDMALNNLERFLSAAPKSLPDLLNDDAAGLETLLPLLGTSQFFADVLAAHPDFLSMLRVPLGHTPGPDKLQLELKAEVDSASDDAAVLRAFRRFRQRHCLRIGTNDIIHDRTLEEVTLDISDVADSAIAVALDTALRTMTHRFGAPHAGGESKARLAVFAFGKLGGQELNYSSDIDLMAVYDRDGETNGRPCIANDEFFARVMEELVRLLSARTEQGQAYRVDLRLRPEGKRGPLARSLASTLDYYDSLGRTWERQALIKLRPVAGDLELGDELLRNIEPFVYHRYLSFAEINDIKAMKRRIEHKTSVAGADRSDVKTGRGGIRDIEFTIQFLQLLNGGDRPDLRDRQTLRAMQALEAAGCLTPAEFTLLDDSYRFLRRIEHRLQLLFDLASHRLPDKPEELQKLALRMGYAERGDRPTKSFAPRSSLDDAPPEVIDTRDLLIDPLDTFLHDFHEKTRLNRQVLDHLLHSTFADAPEEGQPETDLILDPDPDNASIESVLSRYRFQDAGAAYRNLMLLAQEPVAFLSTPRCRHFLASIAPALLRELAATPDPDRALNNLERVTASLGARAVLWESFAFSPPSLKLTVDLCAGSQFLAGILINNPGMIDDLLDSLVLNQPRAIEELRTELAELCRGASDVEPILHSFQDKELLRIGVGDLLGKSNVRDTTLALSDLAEVILSQVATMETRPNLSARFAILGMGKLGAREMSYHSDLDLMLIRDDSKAEGDPFFVEMMQRIIRTLSHMGTFGRLYKVDMRLRPTGAAGQLVSTLSEFEHYFAGGSARLWERQALTRARIVHGDPEFGAEVMSVVRHAAFGPAWRPEHVDEILEMRQRLESSRGPRDVKRGPGGQVDVEFLVQALQLKHAANRPQLINANTWTALEAFQTAALLAPDEHADLMNGYSFLRQVESRLRLMTDRALDEYPESEDDLAILARRLQFVDAATFRATLADHVARIRRSFKAILQRERTY